MKNLLKRFLRENNGSSGPGGFGDRVNFITETQSVSSGVNQQIYGGKRFDSK